MNYIINDASFNINSVFIAQGLELKTEFYLNQLKLLKMFYDADRYSAVKQILKKINQFMHKYIEDERASSIAKMNLAKERRSLEQETDFICEEINYFKKNSLIDYEIHKIRDAFHKNVMDVVIKLYDFEESAYRIIEDISKDIGYNKKISIKQMLWEMA
jgi:hypothetical protein